MKIIPLATKLVSDGGDNQYFHWTTPIQKFHTALPHSNRSAVVHPNVDPEI
jgi:hypothetical protein